MALNFVASTYYAPMILSSEELVETNPLQEILEKYADKKSDFLVTIFRIFPFLFVQEEVEYNWNNSDHFSSYEQDILLPPPDSLRFSS